MRNKKKELSIIKNLKNLLFLISPFWKYGKIYLLGMLFFSVILTPIKSTISILFTQTIIDAVGAGKTFNSIVIIILFFLTFNLITFVLSQLFDSIYAEKKLIQINQKINLEIYNKIILTDYKFFDDPAFYDSYTWTTNEYAAKAKEAVTLLSKGLQSILTIIYMLTFIAILGPWIILISVAQITISTLIEFRTNRININKREESVPIDRKMGYVHRIVCQKDYAADIKATNLKAKLIKMFTENGNKKEKLIKKYALTLLPWLFSINCINTIYDASILGYISYCIIIGKINGVGKFMGLLSANSQLVTSLYSLFGLISQSNSLSLYADNIRFFLESKSVIENDTTFNTKLMVNKKPFLIELNQVAFSYPNSSFSLHDINIKIEPGQRIAIVGENGVGKSTLVKLLLRLYDVDSGSISIDGRCIEKYNIHELRKQIGVAFQSPCLYAFPLITNTGLYNDVTEKKANEIMDLMKLQSILIKNEATLDTELTKEFTKDGIVLSGGEAQKIGIARLLSNDFGLLVFDEPSSSLDPLAEYDLMNMIYCSSQKATSIIIAHRLSTVRNADKIYVMKDGTISESGTHDQLMKAKGLYYDMFTKQAENYVK